MPGAKGSRGAQFRGTASESGIGDSRRYSKLAQRPSGSEPSNVASSVVRLPELRKKPRVPCALPNGFV